MYRSSLLVRNIARTSQKFNAFHASAGAGMARILATDGVDEVCVKLFQQRGHVVDFLPTRPEAELIKIIGDYDGLVVRSATKVTAAVLQNATKMRVIGRAGVGVDNINVPEATKHGIMVMNTPGGNTVSTAQLALSLLCSMARKLPAADMSVKAGKWDRKSFMGVEMSGKTIGIVGCGRIGQVVASCANTMGMHVIGYDPIMAADELAELGIKKVDLSGIWSGSDFITLHTPLTPETTNLLNDTTIASCKDGVMIVNCARGGIVDESALLRGLESGKVAGAALDVYTSEPPKEDLKPLLSHPNLVCTPHLGASTDEAQINVARDVAQQMCDVFDQKDYYGVMNVGYMSASSSPNMAPFMRLAEIIGIFHAQLSTSKVSTVVLRTWGGRDVDITTNMARQLLMAKVLKGVIRHMGLGMSPDIISAPLMAKEVGIVSTISEEMPMKVKLGSPYWNKVSVQVTREDGTSNTIGGVVFGSTPHIVRVDDFADLFAFKPEGSYILSFRNEDRPGAISEVLDILHNVNVNVAGLNVSRQGSVSPQGQALCFMSLDDDIPDKAMTTLHSLSTLSNVAKIELR